MIPSQFSTAPCPEPVGHGIVLLLAEDHTIREGSGFNFTGSYLRMGHVLDVYLESIGVVHNLVKLTPHWRLDIVLGWIWVRK